MSKQDGLRHTSPLGVGVITIFMVLIVLSLAILSALSLSTARGDLHLSQINADTVSAYYRADAEAADLFDSFAAGEEETLESAIPVTENQLLYVRFGRDADGAPIVLAWQTVPAVDDSEWGNFHLPVWEGDETP